MEMAKYQSQKKRFAFSLWTWSQDWIKAFRALHPNILQGLLHIQYQLQ